MCKKKELSVLILAEEEEDKGEFEEALENPVENETTTAGISLSSVVGIDNPRTMKLEGMIGGHKVIVMIDPGATHNFISPDIIQKLDIPVDATEEFGVTLGTGETRLGTGKCKDVEVDLGALCITENFLPLELGHADIILGIEWLAKLGTISTNWKTPLMQFVWKGSKVMLRGDPSLERSMITLKSMMKMIRKNGGGLLIELTSLTKVEGEADLEIPSNIPEPLQQVIQLYAGVFQMPPGLPPLRSKQHQITLKSGSNPVSVRPYCYPQIQKAEIERLVADMLQAGIIQPSQSPFSSPILLVKRKDGSWKFCIDPSP